MFTSCEGQVNESDLISIRFRFIEEKNYPGLVCRNGRTPLTEAVLHDHHEVIQFLRTCGAHFAGKLKYIGEELCR